jgi:hypothetical protein
MWILPKQLISAYAPDTVALTWASGECSQTCAQSLMRRSKPSQSSAYLREWNAGNLMRLRSGAISSLSLGKAFEAWWISSLAATRANHLAQPDLEKDQTIPATSGHLFQMELGEWLPGFVSSRMSRGTSRWDSPASSAIWKSWVLKCRLEYLARLNAARLTNGSESSSWPSPVASEVRQGFQDRSRGMKGSQESLTTVVIKDGLTAQGNHSTHGSRLESWATPQTRDNRSGGAERWDNPNKSRNLNDQLATATTQNAKLNPRWVETLMGLPVGWTMPSCASPVTIAPTSCASSGTE